MAESRLLELLRALIDGWCERRALQPLAALLPAYLAFSGLTDASVDLAQAVDAVRGLGPHVLTDREQASVAEARALLHQSLKATGVTRP